MRRMTGVVGAAGVVTLAMVSTVQAQDARRPTGISRVSRSVAVPQGGSAGSPSTKWTIAGGIATGDSPYDLGFALQASFKTTPQGWPVAIRIDPFVGRWSGSDDFGDAGGNVDFSLTMFGVQGNVQYDFPTTAGSTTGWYVFGGLGVFYGTASAEADQFGGGYDVSGSDTNLGIGIGGGLYFGKRFVLEAQFKSVSDFSTIPILIGIRL